MIYGRYSEGAEILKLLDGWTPTSQAPRMFKYTTFP